MVPAALIWLLLGLLLVLLEWLGVDLDGLLAGAMASLVLSALLALVPMPPLAQMALFAAVTGLLLLALQRWSRQRRQRAIPPTATSGQAAVLSGFGAQAAGQAEEQAEEQTEEQVAGRVQWQGQSWAAVNLDPCTPLRPGDTVLVMGREGTQLQVLPDKRAD